MTAFTDYPDEGFDLIPNSTLEVRVNVSTIVGTASSKSSQNESAIVYKKP